MKCISNRYGNERARAQARESTQSYTVAENANILSTFMPEKEWNGKSCKPNADASHRSASASHR
jgi:hypothetical protein